MNFLASGVLVKINMHAPYLAHSCVAWRVVGCLGLPHFLKVL